MNNLSATLGDCERAVETDHQEWNDAIDEVMRLRAELDQERMESQRGSGPTP